MLAPRRLLAVVAGVLVGAFVVQIVVGWMLGVEGAWLTVLVAAAILGALAIADSGSGATADSGDEAWDVLLCTIAALAVVGAVACLYLPLPWGGLTAAAVLVALIVTLRQSHGH